MIHIHYAYLYESDEAIFHFLGASLLLKMKPIDIFISIFKVNVSVNLITLGSFDPLQVNLVHRQQGTIDSEKPYMFDTQMFLNLPIV